MPEAYGQTSVLALSLSTYVWIDISRQARPHQTPTAPFLEWACGANLMSQDEIEIAAVKLDELLSHCHSYCFKEFDQCTTTGVI